MSTTTMPDDLRSVFGPAPTRSLEQRMLALAEANRIRMARAQLKRDVKAGVRDARTIIAAPPDWADAMKVRELLLAVPKFGVVKANRILSRCQVSPTKRVGGLTDRQRQDLLRALGGR